MYRDSRGTGRGSRRIRRPDGACVGAVRRRRNDGSAVRAGSVAAGTDHGRWWASAPLESNYDPCADSSTVSVMIEGGTGSSPIQAPMFHRGTFLGTGTWTAYGFTSLDESGQAVTPSSCAIGGARTARHATTASSQPCDTTGTE